MYPGGMRIGAEEEKAVLDVLRSKRLFRYYGPYSGTSRVDEFEKAFAAYMGTAHAVAVSSGYTSLACGLAALGVGPGAVRITLQLRRNSVEESRLNRLASIQHHLVRRMRHADR
jgi:dTDP-4-amino-4,6-dideoxygalactose transaminase